MDSRKDAVISRKKTEDLYIPPAADHVAGSKICTGRYKDSPGVLGVRGPASRSGGGTEPVSPAAGCVRAPPLPSRLLRSPATSSFQNGMVTPGWDDPSLVSTSPRRSNLDLAPCPAFRGSPALPTLQCGCGSWLSWPRAWGPAGGVHPSVILVSLRSLARPPVAPTWAPQDAPPAKRWPPGRRGARSGRGKDPGDPLGCGAGRRGTQESAGPEKVTQNVKIHEGKGSLRCRGRGSHGL